MASAGGPAMGHRQAVAAMVVATLLWSIAGVVTRHLEAARSFEVTFWRSAFNALALGVWLIGLRRPALRWPQIRDGGWALWASGLCWTVMFTAFMVALTLTTVANVLVTMALAPLLTAMIARIVLGHRLPARTWAAIFIAGGGIAWMYGHELGDAEASQGLGVTLALCVPVAAAANWTMLQHAQHDTAGRDMLPAVLIGAVLSALVTLPFAWPFAGSLRDVGWLALLGIVQLAVPCMLLVAVARALPAPEIALLGLLEVVFGVAWAWLGAGEVPSPSVLGGGALVLCALAADQALSLRRVPRV